MALVVGSGRGCLSGLSTAAVQSQGMEGTERVPGWMWEPVSPVRHPLIWRNPRDAQGEASCSLVSGTNHPLDEGQTLRVDPGLAGGIFLETLPSTVGILL